MNSFKLPIKWAGTAMLALFLSSTLNAAEPFSLLNGASITLECAQALSAEAEISIHELPSGSGHEWSMEIAANRRSLVIAVTAGPGGLPANADLIEVEVFDPSTGYQETWRLGTGGGATLLVIADL